MVGSLTARIQPSMEVAYCSASLVLSYLNDINIIRRIQENIRHSSTQSIALLQEGITNDEMLVALHLKAGLDMDNH